MIRNLNLVTTMVIVFAVLYGCAPSIRYTAMEPARKNQTTLAREIAVLPFEGEDGKSFALEIEEAISSIKVDGKPFYTMVESGTVAVISEEMKFAPGELKAEKDSVKLGSMIGVKGIYMGSLKSSVSENSYSESRQRCIKRKKQSSNDAAKILFYIFDLDCVEWERFTVNCTARNAYFSFTPKLVDVSTGRVLFAETYSGSADSKKCDDQWGSLKNQDALLQQAKGDAKQEFKKDIGPHWITCSVKLMNSKNGILADDAIEKFDNGLEFAKEQRMDRACQLWKEAQRLSKSSNSLSLIYNLGVCFEINGELERARENYRTADLLLSKPNENVSLALARIEDRIIKTGILKEQISAMTPSQSHAILYGEKDKRVKAKAERGTPSEAVALVEDAIDYMEENGLASALREIGRNEGRFWYKDMHLVMMDTKGICLAHHRSDFIGKDLATLKDLDGKMFMRDLILVAKKKGAGWIDFKRLDPETNFSATKSLYLRKVPGKNLLISCSIFK